MVQLCFGGMSRESRTVCRTTAAEDGISSCAFDCSDYRAGRSDAFHVECLGFQVCARVFDSYGGVGLSGRWIWHGWMIITTDGMNRL